MMQPTGNTIAATVLGLAVVGNVGMFYSYLQCGKLGCSVGGFVDMIVGGAMVLFYLTILGVFAGGILSALIAGLKHFIRKTVTEGERNNG